MSSGNPCWTYIDDVDYAWATGVSMLHAPPPPTGTFKHVATC